MSLLKPCLVCGEPSDQTYCAEHSPSPRRPSRAAGYDRAWDRLSARARQLQPWCTDCGATQDLTADHSRQAWARKAQGLAIRLEDVEVCCRSCNARRGRSRPGEDPRPEVSGSRWRGAYTIGNGFQQGGGSVAGAESRP